MRGLLVAVALLSMPSAAVAQTAAAQPTALSSPAPHWTRTHRPVSTTNAAAQAAFDHGLTLLYAFNPQEARREFEAAGAADPHLALAQWGIAMSYGININTSFDPAQARLGHDAIVKAQSLEAFASPVERALIAAAAERFAHTAKNDGDVSARTYADAMRSVATKYPDDDDAATLAAEAAMDAHPWNYWTDDGKPEPGVLEIIQTLQTVLARNPAHIGANHLLIHAVEGSPRPDVALSSARRLAADDFEPAAEHLAHMPAHTFMRTGDYAAAAHANVLALDDLAAYDAGPHAPEHDEYRGHDCLFGVDALMMAGEHAEAVRTAARCGSSAGRYAGYVAVRFRRWNDLAQYAGETPFLRAMSDAAAKRYPEALTAARQLDAEKQDVATIAADVVRATVAAGENEPDAAIASLEKAVREQDKLSYGEPPAWFFPVRETLGAAYYRSERYADAERTFRTDLERNPRNPRSLYGLAQTLAREGKTADSAAAMKAFSAAWKQADVQLDMSEL